jgi:hypothetical protein
LITEFPIKHLTGFRHEKFRACLAVICAEAQYRAERACCECNRNVHGAPEFEKPTNMQFFTQICFNGHHSLTLLSRKDVVVLAESVWELPSIDNGASSIGIIQ